MSLWLFLEKNCHRCLGPIIVRSYDKRKKNLTATSMDIRLARNVITPSLTTLISVEKKRFTFYGRLIQFTIHDKQTPRNTVSDQVMHCLLKLQEVKG